MQHSLLSPSSSSRWLSCTASVDICSKYENSTNKAAEWGTTVHELGELMLLDKPLPKATKEQLECAEEYYDYCMALVKPDTIKMVETRFDLSFIAPDTFGTGDFSCINGKHLDIVDLKTGHNIVYAEENTQLMIYALGAIYELEIYGIEVETVTLHIMQSRANHIDTWETSYAELKEFEKFVVSQAKKITTGKTEFKPSKKGCAWCPHKPNCIALREHVEHILKGGFEKLEDLDGKADEINLDHLKNVLDNADLISSFVTACQEIALERMQNGEEIEGYKLVESRTNRKWADEDAVAKYLTRKIKSEDLWVKKLAPMTKILKLRPNDKDLEAMLVKPQGKPMIALSTDKRQAITNVKDCFEDLSSN